MPSPEWFTLILQAGAFGLICYIVIVIYPKHAKDSRDEREKRDAAFITLIELMQDKFEERNERIVHAVEQQTHAITASLRDSSERMERAMSVACRQR